MEEILGNEVLEDSEDDESEVMSSEEAKEGFTNLMRCLSGKRFPRNYDDEEHGEDGKEEEQEGEGEEGEEEEVDYEKRKVDSDGEDGEGIDMDCEMDAMEVDVHVNDSSEESDDNN